MSKDKKTRIGAYGVAVNEGKLLLIVQQRGPFAGRFDFPGGGIEFGESVESALRREFVEEVGMEFTSLEQIANITTLVDVPASLSEEPYLFFHIGLLYRVQGCRNSVEESLEQLQYEWVDPAVLTESACSALLWKYRERFFSSPLEYRP